MRRFASPTAKAMGHPPTTPKRSAGMICSGRLPCLPSRLSAVEVGLHRQNAVPWVPWPRPGEAGRGHVRCPGQHARASLGHGTWHRRLGTAPGAARI